MDTLQEVCEIFECLTYLVKDLDKTMKILVDEFANIKTEVATLKKNQKMKIGYDEQQKNADIKEILLADSNIPFVDLKQGGQNEFNLEKAFSDYYFYFIHDHALE